MSKQIFSENEIKRILKRAAELESERSISGNRNLENGLTVYELKNIASETGLDPELIEQAVSEMNVVPDVQKEEVQVNHDEISSEAWMIRKPNKETLNMLIKELNNMHGTTDKFSWWEKLWRKHKGKAIVERTSKMTEWIYTSQSGAFFTRVLLQQRGERFRIRVSKRQIYNLDWDSAAITFFWLVVPVAILLGIFGAVVSENLFGTFWPGLVTGILLSLFSYPFIRKIDKKHIDKQKAEVEKTIQVLSELVLQSTSKEKSKSYTSKKNNSISEIEIPKENSTTKAKSGRLNNNLRE